MRCAWAFLVLAANALAFQIPPSYVGSTVCARCHAEIYRSYKKTDMGQSMRRAGELTEMHLPPEATVRVGSGSKVIRLFRDKNGWHQSEIEPGVFDDEHALDYAVGSGANGMSFLVRRGNYLFQAPLSFYSQTKRWDLSPGYEYGDLGFSRSVPEDCIYCHSGRAQVVANHPGEYRDPPFLELAVGCENCHGPGGSHASDPVRGSIVNPAKLNARLAEDICMRCHQAGDTRILQPGKTLQDALPGQWLINTMAILKAPAHNDAQREVDLLQHNAAMKESRCFRQSAGKLSCLTCHNPHVQPSAAEAPSYFRAKCFTCHTDDSCKLPLSTRNLETPPDNCAGCHMPKRNIRVISHSALTNHRIPARPDEPLAPAKYAANADLLVVNQAEGQKDALPKISLLRAYSELAPNSSEYQQRYFSLLDELSHSEPNSPYVQAALAHKALSEGKNDEVLDHLKIGIQLGDATVYEDKAKALANLGRVDEAVGVFTEGIKLFPFHQELRKNLILEYINSKRYKEAKDAMQEFVALFPEDDFMRRLLRRTDR